ncbi:MAG: SDR family NAD(P)-dependent oxidoreductase, partial [Candidatus Eisenbacteria bacterium]|nr:SDR family NAD(P)-dependent oxidoreductase [Candidatus Eisenbacteria bacterium]
MELANRIVFVTGASSGIGAACALAFARAGAKVLLCARREDRLDDVVESLRRTGVEAYGIGLDAVSYTHLRAHETALCIWYAV